MISLRPVHLAALLGACAGLGWGQTPITLTSSLNPSTFGQAVTLTAQLLVTVSSGTTITFRDGGLSIGTATTNANGLATFTTSTLSAGSHNLTATAVAVTGGNLNSNTVTQVVSKANSTTAFSSTPDPSFFGQAVTLTANVTPAGATGTVNFVEGNIQIGAGTVNGNGVATFTTTTLAVGTHRMAANYVGNANFNGSSGAGNQTVNQASSTTTVTASPNPAVVGASVTITATVSTGATGTVTFFDGSTQLGQPTSVTSATATLSTSNLAIGNHPLTAVYSGDTNFIGSTSASFLETISRPTTRTTLAVNPTSATTGQTVTLTATVTASTGAAGNVTFSDNGSALGTSNLSGGTAVFPTSFSTAGTHSLTAAYAGDTNNAPSTSAPVSLTVTQGTVSTTTTLTASPNPATFGQSVTFTATVTPATATGTVTFNEGPNNLGVGTLSNGTATFVTATLAVGTHSVIANYGGDTKDAASASAVFSLTVNQTTQVTLTALPNPSTFGQSVTLTATVTPTNSTGTVSFRDGGTQIGTGAVSASGIATFSTTALTVGSHALTAVLGNATSNSVTQVVGKAATTTSLGLSQTTSTPGQPVTLTATVIPAAATGSVAFFDGSTQIGSGTLANGTATMATSTLTVGSHSLSAVYGGDGNFTGSTGTASLAVGQGNSATSLTATPNPANSGQVVTLTATVVPASATGTVTFKDGATTIGSAPLSNGVALTTISTLTVGSHSLTASYGGDTVVGPSTSTPVVEVINQTVTPTTTTLSVAPPSPVNAGQVVTLTAVVAPASATGTVTFKDSNTTIGAGNLTNGTASTTTSTLTPGSHSLTATYSGDTTNSPSTSAVVVLVVNPVSAGVILTASPNPANAGQAVTLNATVNPASATGIITFRDGANSIGTGTISGGSANVVTSTLAVGSHSLTASYLGDASNGASTSTAVVEVINQSNSGVTLTATPNPAALGQTVTLTATVLPSTATGTITIFDSATAGPVGGTATLSNGVATITTSTLKVGTHALQAFYSGDANTGSGQSNFVTEVINAASTTPTTTTLTVSPESSAPGQLVTMTATVTPSGATGNVTFRDGSAGLGTGTLNGGTATFSTTSLAAGIHTLSAAYPGDGNFAASNSNPINQTVTAGTAACVPFPASFVPFSAGATVSKANSAGDLLVVGSMSAANFTTLQNLALPTGANQQFCGTVFLAPNLPVVAYVPTPAERAGDFSPFAGLLIDPASNTAFPGGVIPASRIPATFAWRIATALQNSTTSITATPTTATPGQTVTLSAIVTPFSATGTVTFLEGTTTLGIATLSGGTATTTISTLSAGAHSITASYAGDANNGPSISTAVTVTVGGGGTLTPTRTVLTVAPTSSAFGAPVTLTATVTPSTAAGTVTFLDSAGSGTAVLGTQTLSNGTATLTTPNLAPGTHALTASYGGNSTNAPSTSTAVTVTITGTLTATRTVLTVAPTSSTVGQAVTFTAVVTPSAATGTVTFLDGSATLGTASLNAGTATFTNSSLTAGTHSLTASYGGDANNAASTSTAVTETVTAPTALRISAPTTLPAAFVGTAYSQTFAATGGSGQFTWSLLSGTTELNMSPAGVLSGTPRTAGTFTLGVNVRDSAGQANGAAITLTVEPAVPPLSITVTQPPTITVQPAPQASLGQSYPVALNATFRLTFAPNAAGLPANFTNSAVQFRTGGTTSDAVAIPANSTAPVALPPVQLGDVAGVITVQLNTLTIASTGQAAPLPAPVPSVAITVPRLAPIIVPGSVKLTNITSSGFQVTLVASSTPRDLTNATVTFTAASGTQLNGATPPAVSLTSAAATWFDPANATGVASGGSFALTLPFTYSGDTNALGSVSVILKNSIGDSTAVAGGR